jgi:hypothetical protein
MLDAGVDVRDVQIAARHADPRTTMRYDRARQNLDRHPNYIREQLKIIARTAPGPLRLAEPSWGQTRACLTVKARGPVVRQAQGAVADVRIRRW